MDSRPDAQEALTRIFGFDQFRPHQQAVIDHVIDGGDALVLMPTGGGKSLCYQIPGLVRPGTAVVVSPLIALMQDQVESLAANGVQAEVLNSSLSGAQQAHVQDRFRRGELDFLYLAPERLVREDTLTLLQSVAVALFAIDEAHCVSQWGHDFRPEYRQLKVLAEQFPQVPRLALTATADERTRSDIVAELDLTEARRFISSFDRPNIRYRITGKRNAKQQLLSFLRDRDAGASGIIYCLSRRKVDEIAQWLSERGYVALPYHAGLTADTRAENQRRFIVEEDVIVVATIAFGMGIDKPNVRYVAHLDLPKSIEGYYQETGRAGRDGLPAEAWMVYGFGEMRTLLQFIQGSDSGDAHKRIERTKLDSMLALCETADCRRRVLLGHFGETLEEDCGNCDNCLEPPETYDGLEAAQLALSTIYRTGQRFGVAHVVDVLRGGESDRVRRFRHDRLNVYGRGADRSAREWRAILRQLVAQNLVEIDFDNYGVLRLTQASRPILRGERELRLVAEKAGQGGRRQGRKAAPGLDASDQQLFDELRALRMTLATQAGVPPYVVFGDATLIEMARVRPHDRMSLLDITGVGPHKLEQYGERFLAVIQSRRSSQQDAG